MFRLFDRRLTRLLQSGLQGLLKGGWIGLEKETLRVAPDDSLARTPHPPTLGAPLTHPFITTDYSEALLEFITPPFPDARAALRFLHDIHQFVHHRVGDELLWATSMPCVMGGEDNIPLAWYGTSNLGMMKHIYRRGLGYRYGRTMQVIAGVHFNYSLAEEFWPVFQEQEGDRRPLPAFRAESYFGMIRNLQRFGWLVPYLFGVSPAVCKSFLHGRPTALAEFDADTYFGPYATSLRMSDIGYTNSREKGCGLSVSYDSLEAYIDSLAWAIRTPCPEYEKIGVVVDGEYRQLNANHLQIEAEYYSTVRAKQAPAQDEKPSLALKRRGIQYVELRSVDVNAFEPAGVNEEQLRFLEAFMVFCLLQESPLIGPDERQEIDANQIATANRGRDPALRLYRSGQPLALRDWALEVAAALEGICQALDGADPERPYSRALAVHKESIADPERTPSARMLAEMRQRKEAFFHFARRQSEQHRAYFRGLPPNPEFTRLFEEEAERSWARQRELETADKLSFAEYLQHYFAQQA